MRIAGSVAADSAEVPTGVADTNDASAIFGPIRPRSALGTATGNHHTVLQPGWPFVFAVVVLSVAALLCLCHQTKAVMG
jgi:hypothetical protein